MQIVAITPGDDLASFAITQGLTQMKILLAVDGSPCSDVAVEEMGRRPWPEGSSVKVLNAFELPLPVLLLGELYGSDPRSGGPG